MCKSEVHHLAIVDNIEPLIRIETPKSLAVELQKELLRTREQLQCEIAQRCSLELALKKAEAELEKRVEKRATELKDAYEQLLPVINDISVYQQAGNNFKSSLKQKEVLLKEIHHRVKNNLQIIASLLRLQSRYINDEKILDIFQDSQNRIRAMAMIHENLYQSHDLERIEVFDYIKKIIDNLISSYGVKDNIKIHFKFDKFLLKINTAIPCGLIINELISNAIKHAFPQNKYGDIYVSFLNLDNDKYLLKISDNGVGLQENIELYKNQSLGLQLVWNLVEQLEGNITFNQVGTIFTIVFVEPN